MTADRLDLNGSCWDEGPRMVGVGVCDPMPLKCRLRAGHAGAHRDGRAEWMGRDPYNQVVAERDAAQAALARVRAQHSPVDGVYADAPTVCGNRYCRDDATDQFAWPCPTMRAITGEGQEAGD